jgi:Zn-dependent protease with chaperone function
MLAVRRPAPNTPVEVIASSRLVAYARPGRPGRVVVSQGMLEALSGEEQLVLFAHERAHLRHHHHRYIAAADACARAIPLLAPLAASVRFACERWADEEAASVVGERKLVARAVAVAALAEAGAPALSFGGNTGGVPARVEALLDPPAEPGRVSTLLLSLPAVVTVGAALLQAQRLGEVVDLVVGSGQL